MTSSFTQHLCAALIGVAILSSCSRPVAYFQRGTIDPSSTTKTQTVNIASSAQDPEATIEPFTQANATIAQVDAYVRNDSKLATNKKLIGRMDRVKNLLASTRGALAPNANAAPLKLNVVQRIMLKKMNKKIGHQLAPSHPEKAMINNQLQLIIGFVLLIGGLLLLITGTGTAAFIGLIIALVGALSVILGLFGT